MTKSIAPMIMMLAGCLGSAPSPQFPSSDTHPDGSSVAPSSSDGGVQLGTMICRDALALSGQWQQGNAPPSGFPGGCWPDGTWSFSANVSQSACSSAPVLAAQYRFQVVEDADYNDTITYLNDPTDASASLKITGGEGGVCTGAFLLFSADGKTVINLRPALQADGSINGQGEYQIWTADQR
jgi:hypothetical protein